MLVEKRKVENLNRTFLCHFVQFFSHKQKFPNVNYRKKNGLHNFIDHIYDITSTYVMKIERDSTCV